MFVRFLSKCFQRIYINLIFKRVKVSFELSERKGDFLMNGNYKTLINIGAPSMIINTSPSQRLNISRVSHYYNILGLFQHSDNLKKSTCLRKNFELNEENLLTSFYFNQGDITILLYHTHVYIQIFNRNFCISSFIFFFKKCQNKTCITRFIFTSIN